MSVLGEGLAKKAEANSQQAHVTADFRAEQSAALRAKHKEKVSGNVKLIFMGIVLFVVGMIVLKMDSSVVLLTWVSMAMIIGAAVFVALGLVTRYCGE